MITKKFITSLITVSIFLFIKYNVGASTITLFQSDNNTDLLVQSNSNSLKSPKQVKSNYQKCKENIGEFIDSNQKKHKSDATIPIWLIIPFILLLAMIATGPVSYSIFWHKYYVYIACLLALLVTSVYIFVFKNYSVPINSIFEYVQFISLIGALYIASSGILIKINTKAGPIVNLTILFTGAILSNVIGTTGASMLLVKPFINLNKGRLRTYHIIFFIFMISNIGGALTAIGDPPLFLGFLKGVPFSWTLIHNTLPWLTALGLLGIIFLFLDFRNTSKIPEKSQKFHLTIRGKKNFIWLALIIVVVFLDPNIFNWVPNIELHGHKHSYLRECILLLIAYFSYKGADKIVFKENEFSFEPLKEVVFIFIGIFGTMAPALELIATYAESDYGKSIINPNTLYWGTGILSSFLDNAPTYLNFLSASMGSHGADISNITDVQNYAQGSIYHNSLMNLKAISISAVFFGAMTYIGNGPNFMVKAIAEKMNIKMPSFFGYIFKYSLIILLPVLIIVWLIFFKFAI